MSRGLRRVLSNGSCNDAVGDSERLRFLPQRLGCTLLISPQIKMRLFACMW